MTTPYELNRQAFTFAMAGENHVGSEITGTQAATGTGETFADLQSLEVFFKDKGYTTELTALHKLACLVPKASVEDAGLLVVREYLKDKQARAVHNELMGLQWNAEYIDWKKDRRDENNQKIHLTGGLWVKGRLLKQHARRNLIIQKGVEKTSTFAQYGNNGTVVDCNRLRFFSPVYEQLMDDVATALPCSLAAKHDFIAEGNLYHKEDAYIGWHGDTERNQVMCLSLGRGNFPLRFCWKYKGEAVSEVFETRLNSGDLYIMSEKAVGSDWKKRNTYTLVHSAGDNKSVKKVPGRPKRKRD